VENDKPSRSIDRIYVLFFLTGIWLPLIGGVLRIGSLATTEKRRLASFPVIRPTHKELARNDTVLGAYLASLEQYPREFDAYYDDHFGFRTSFIRAHSIFMYYGLGMSPTSKVVRGKDGWLYYAGQGNIETYRGEDLFDEAELDTWTERFEEIEEWLADRDVRYLVVIAPSKPNIYPEFLPSSVRKVGTVTRLDQLQARLAERTKVELLDLRPALLRAKRDGLVYLKHDSHWSMFGGFSAYRALAERLQVSHPELDLLETDDFRFETWTRYGGDLTNILDLADEMQEEELKLLYQGTVPYTWETEGLLPPIFTDGEVSELRQVPGATVQDAPGSPHVVLFHDSFSVVMIPFLAHSVRRGVYYWQPLFDPRVVAREDPDLVIHEIGERILMIESLGRPAPALRRDFHLRRAYRAKVESIGSLAGRPLAAGSTSVEVPLALDRSGDVVLRIDIESPEGTELRVLRGVGSTQVEVDRRRLQLEREIVYAELQDLEPGEDVLLELDLPDAEGKLRSVEARR